MYTKVTDPLPPHSTQPYPQFALNAMTMRRAQIELWVRQARAGTLCAPNPVDYASLGPQIMKNVSRVAQQGTLTGANALADYPSPILAVNHVEPVPSRQGGAAADDR